MREILYRGKCIETGQWVYGSFVMDGTELVAIEAGKKPFLTSWGFIRRYNAETGKVDMFEVERQTVGQYTGVSDKNAKRIFEGDIIRNSEFDEEDGYGIVEFSDGAFEVNGHGLSCTFHENFWGTECEVIGNIHDNPELLGGADNG